MFISSRVCGVCGGVHSVASSLAIEMAFGIAPPPMGLALRNIQLALDFMLDNPLHLYVLAGPDYSQLIVERTTPSLWAKAQKTDAPHGDIHGHKTIGDMMRALNPLTGQLYLEGIQMTRIPREAYALLYGKYPHPQTVLPGGRRACQEPDRLRHLGRSLRLRRHLCVGAELGRTPLGDTRRRHRREARHDQPPSHQHRAGGIRGAFVLRRMGERGLSVPHRPGRQSLIAAPSLEQRDQARARHQTQLEGPLHVG